MLLTLSKRLLLSGFASALSLRAIWEECLGTGKRRGGGC